MYTRDYIVSFPVVANGFYALSEIKKINDDGDTPKAVVNMITNHKKTTTSESNNSKIKSNLIKNKPNKYGKPTKNSKHVLAIDEPKTTSKNENPTSNPNKINQTNKIVDVNNDGKNKIPISHGEDRTRPNKNETQRINDIIKLHTMMGHIGNAALSTALDNGIIIGTYLISKDVRLYEKFGPCCHACEKGKATQDISYPSVEPLPSKIGETVHTDIIFIKINKKRNQPYLFSVDAYSAFVMIKKLKSKHAIDVLNGIKKIYASYWKCGYQINTWRTDNENVFSNLRSKLTELKCNLITIAPGRHEKRCERWIQTFKQRMRTFKANLEYQIPNFWNKYLVKEVIKLLNHTPNALSGHKSPMILFEGIRCDIQKINGYFGQLGIVKVPNINDDSTYRSEHCIYLRSTTRSTNVKVYSLTTKRIVVRRNFKPCDMTKDILESLRNITDISDSIEDIILLDDNGNSTFNEYTDSFPYVTGGQISKSYDATIETQLDQNINESIPIEISNDVDNSIVINNDDVPIRDPEIEISNDQINVECTNISNSEYPNNHINDEHKIPESDDEYEEKYDAIDWDKFAENQMMNNNHDNNDILNNNNQQNVSNANDDDEVLICFAS